MNGLLDRLLSQLKERGLSVGPGREPGQLMLHGPERERTPEIMKALALFKPQLLEKFGRQPKPAAKKEERAEPDPEPDPELCRVCGRNVSDPEDRERMIDPAHCDRGGGKAYRDQDGIEHQEEQRCPFKR